MQKIAFILTANIITPANNTIEQMKENNKESRAGKYPNSNLKGTKVLNQLLKPNTTEKPIIKRVKEKNYTDEEKQKIVHNILLDISEGVNITTACEAQNIPFRTFYDWILKDKSFAQLYDFSRKAQAQKWLNDYFLRITDNSNDVYNGKRDNVQVQRDRLIGDTLKWYASKLLPQEYGDKLEIEHTGKQSNTINQINIQVNKYEDEPQQISIKKSAPNGEEKGGKSTTTHTKSKNNLKALEAEIIEEIGEVGIGRLNLSKTDRIGKSGVEDNLDILDINGVE